MITLLVQFLGLVAAVAWIASLVAAIGIYQMMPQGHKLKSFFNLGWLNFDHIHEIAGPGAKRLTRLYVWGLLVFLVAVLALIAVSVLMVIESREADNELQPTVSSLSLKLPTLSQET
jgi:hypothetical protein